jgi:glucose-1-phosphate thymidylyltransferase
LAGGRGTRLWPTTVAVNKQLLPVYDKPMIYYPLSVLMLAGIREILVISQSNFLTAIECLLGDGNQFGLEIAYAAQNEPNGIADAFLIGEEFIGPSPSVLILGDNVFYGNDLSVQLEKISRRKTENTIFGYYIDEPEGLGVVVLDDKRKPVEIIEKPLTPVSNWSIPGIYFYAPGIADVARTLKPSKRGELEISDLNTILLSRGDLNVELLGRGIAWLDSGTHDTLLDASEFVRVMERRTGLKICCPEEIAYSRGYIDSTRLKTLADNAGDNSYGRYLRGFYRRN